LIKLYQFFPHLANESYISLIFLLSLLCGNSNSDFLSISYLVNDKVQCRELCASVISCAELLDSCKFIEFWQAYRRIGIVTESESTTTETTTTTTTNTKEESTLPFQPSFLTKVATSSKSLYKVRTYILKLLSLSYQYAPLSSIVLPALDFVSKDDFDTFLAYDDTIKCIVAKVDDNVVEFVSTINNTKKCRIRNEGIEFDTIANLMMNASQ